MVFGLLILAFVGGGLLMAWVAQNWQMLSGSPPPISGALSNGGDLSQNSVGTPDAALPPVPAQGLAASADTQAARVTDLEQRLARIAIATQAASYNANRAEALLTAFAARRALDSGRALGYVENTLRLRFGDAQPKAVATIINAAAEPVTLSSLRVGLLDIDVAVHDQRNAGSSWQTVWREIGSLAIIRRAGAPSPEPEQRLTRARHALELGQIDNAIAEISALPPQPRIARWLEMARRYNEAHRALDVVEAAAILEPRSVAGAVPPLPVLPIDEDKADKKAAGRD